MEASHGHHEHVAAHGHHGDEAERVVHDQMQHDHDWSDEEWVEEWIERQAANAPQQRHLFTKVRSLVPRTTSEAFRYLNLGAGAGDLDEMILDRFVEARATLLDSSLPMLAHARRRLDRFEDRVEYVQANLSNPNWVDGTVGPFDVVVSTRAIHHAGEAGRIRELFGEILGILGHGGLFINLDYVRLARPTFQQLGAWAAADPEAGFHGGSPHMALPSSVEEQLAWMRETGFGTAECVYREFQTAILIGIADHLHVPGVASR